MLSVGVRPDRYGGRGAIGSQQMAGGTRGLAALGRASCAEMSRWMVFIRGWPAPSGVTPSNANAVVQRGGAVDISDSGARSTGHQSVVDDARYVPP